MSRLDTPRLSRVLNGPGPQQGLGRYLVQPHNARTTTVGTNNTLELVPIWVARECLIDTIGFEQTTAAGAGGVARMGIWAPQANTDEPDKMLYGSSTIGTTGGNGAKEFTGIGLHVLPGLYWLGCVPQVAAATFRTTTTTGSCYTLADSAAPVGTGVGGGSYTKTGVSGSLADIGGITALKATGIIQWALLA